MSPEKQRALAIILEATMNLRKNMTARLTFFLGLTLIMRSAGAIDIPMDRHLAMEALDSKTCYSTVKSRGQLVGNELNDLLVSSSGKLVRLAATGAFVIGKLQPRRYVGDGVAVTIVPQKVASHGNDDEELSVVLEEGFADIDDHGRRKRIPVKVSEICTP